MPAFTTEGVVVKRVNFGEADRVVTVITPYKGKISLVARGVRKITSRRAGNIELLNRVRLHIYQGRGMGVLSEAESIDTFEKVKSDLALSSYGSHCIEIAERLLPQEQPNPEAYKLLISILTLLNTHPRQLWIRAYEVKLLTSLGFWGLDQLDVGGDLKEILDQLQKKKWDELDDIQIDSGQALELERILRYHIEKILEGKLRSLDIIQDIKNNNGSK